MKAKKLLGTALLILCLVSALLPLGCKKRVAATGNAPTPVRIQLSEPSAEVLLQTVENKLVFVIHCKVKYRFIEGAPQTGETYNVMGDVVGLQACILKIGEGSAVKAEGEVDGKYPLLRPSQGLDYDVMKKANVKMVKSNDFQLPKEVVYQPKEGTGRLHSIGDEVKCTVKVQDSYPVP